jgi:hypothetical protein
VALSKTAELEIFLVMAGLVPAIHVFFMKRLEERRGCPEQAPA